MASPRTVLLAVLVYGFVAWPPVDAAQATALALGGQRLPTRGRQASLVVEVDGHVGPLPPADTAGAALVSAAQGPAARGANCSYGAGFDSSGPAPFVYRRSDGKGYASPQAAPGPGGVCLFPDVACGIGSIGDCCSTAPWVQESVHSSDLLVLLASMMVTIPIILMTQCWRARNRSRLDDVTFDARDGFNYMSLYLTVIVNINTAWIMARWTQQALKVYDRNAMLAATAFLTPLADVFLFLEDAVAVQIGYAIGSGDNVAVGYTFNLGVVGGLLLGTMAASLTTALSMWPSAMELLVAPGHQAIQGCALVPSAADVVSGTRTFWLLTSWSWPFGFASMALAGFFLGTRYYGVLLAATLVSKFVLFWVWGHSAQDLDGLATASAASVGAFFAFSMLCLLLHCPMRQRYNLGSLGDLLSWFCAPGGSKLDAFGDPVRLKRVLRQGGQAMVCDLCVQICISSGIYVASSIGLPALYQVSAMQAAMPLYVGSVAGVAYAMKLLGSSLLGLKMFDEFRFFVNFTLLMGILYGVVVVFAVEPHTAALSFAYAPQACEFATDAECAGMYRGVFGSHTGGGGELQHTLRLLPAAAVAASFFSIVKAGLSSCFDFAFMCKAAGTVLLVCYVPAAMLALFVYKTPFAVCAAMYVPVCALAVICLIRLQAVATRVGRVDGPWNEVETLGSKPAPLSGAGPAGPGLDA